MDGVGRGTCHWERYQMGRVKGAKGMGYGGAS